VSEASSNTAIVACPVCDGPVEQQKCKLVCTRCRAIVENCSGD
jgi:hypothetical protein